MTVAPDGPLYVRGDVEIAESDGEVLLGDTRVALCRCGLSVNKPLCDNSHADGAFEAEGTVQANDSEGTEPPTGPLKVIPIADGPILLQGAFEIRGGDHGEREQDEGEDAVFRDSRTALCRCGASADKPFCDGTHAEIGFESE